VLFKKREETLQPQTIVFEGIAIEVVKRKIKNIYLYIKPPHGDVQLRVPISIKEKDIRAFLESKRAWLLQKQQQIISRPKPVDYRYVNDEIHYYNGEAYKLQVEITKKKQHVEISENDTMKLMVKEHSTFTSCESVMNKWYKEQLMILIKHYVALWEPIMKVSVVDIGIKKMKTKWGTCNTTTKKIWLNLKLAKKSPQVVEYVVVHEMVHLLERKHNQRFKGFMSLFLPNWKQLHKQLQQQID
jgi:predicted metal-dependent hydrolase